MRFFGIIAVLLMLAACSDSGGPEAGPTRTIEVVGMAQFQAAPLDTIPDTLSIRVADLLGRPLSGVAVAWTTPDGGALIPLAPTTDSAGLAAAIWVLGWHSGDQSAVASAENVREPAGFGALAIGFQALGLSTGDGTSMCAINTDRFVYCWETGYRVAGHVPDRVPVRMPLTLPVTEVVTTLNAICAMTASGAIYCWDTSPDHLPLPAPEGSYKALTATYSGVCAISTTGDAYCWGDNVGGRFGVGPLVGVIPPTLVLGGFPWQQFALGDDRGCGVRVGGQVYCWGKYPEWLGTGVDTNTNTPLPVLQAPLMDSVTLSGYHQCGVLVGYRTYCWGENHNIGKLGLPSGSIVPYPLMLDNPPYLLSIRSGFKPTFALGVDGVGYWWGPPQYSTGGEPYVPTAFTGEIRLSAIGTGETDTCGIEEDTSTVYCWGGFGWTGPSRVWAVPPP